MVKVLHTKTLLSSRLLFMFYEFTKKDPPVVEIVTEALKKK